MSKLFGSRPSAPSVFREKGATHRRGKAPGSEIRTPVPVGSGLLSVAWVVGITFFDLWLLRKLNLQPRQG